MKTLQNNFTTPEQSKRLLELGVPEDSADCYLVRTNIKGDTFIVEVFHDEQYSWKDKYENILEYLPCWSVGRLMAIYFISKGIDFWSPQFKKYQIENSAEYFVSIIANNIKDLDFSKLEE